MYLCGKNIKTYSLFFGHVTDTRSAFLNIPLYTHTSVRTISPSKISPCAPARRRQKKNKTCDCTHPAIKWYLMMLFKKKTKKTLPLLDH